MTKLDQFESVFRSAIRMPFTFQPRRIERCLLVTDLPAEEQADLQRMISAFVANATGISDLTWSALENGPLPATPDLIDEVARRQPDLICSYRNLESKAWKRPHSLGDRLDVLLQRTDAPVLVIPHPKAEYARSNALQRADRVMVITDVLSNDDRLVNAALAFTHRDATLHLAHIEDQANFDRYMDAISKIPNIDTDFARSTIAEQLLKEPRQYVESCRAAVKANDLGIEVEEIVEFGHHVRECRRLVDANAIDLVVLNTKAEDQLAMHGLAYPLAVELRQIPLLFV